MLSNLSLAVKVKESQEKTIVICLNVILRAIRLIMSILKMEMYVTVTCAVDTPMERITTRDQSRYVTIVMSRLLSSHLATAHMTSLRTRVTTKTLTLLRIAVPRVITAEDQIRHSQKHGKHYLSCIMSKICFEDFCILKHLTPYTLQTI